MDETRRDTLSMRRLPVTRACVRSLFPPCDFLPRATVSHYSTTSDY